MHDVPIDIWHAALLMPIIWTFAAFFYAGMRWERARRPPQHVQPWPPPLYYTTARASAGMEIHLPTPAATASKPTRTPRLLQPVLRLFLRIATGRRH